MDIETKPRKRDFHDDFRWDGVSHMPYKQDGSAPFKDVSRQVLFQEPGMGCELRYFEMDAGGYSTLEQHEHAHAVMILRGHGHCLLGGEVVTVKPFDLVTIPSWTWHQFRADAGREAGLPVHGEPGPRPAAASDSGGARGIAVDAGEWRSFWQGESSDGSREEYSPSHLREGARGRGRRFALPQGERQSHAPPPTQPPPSRRRGSPARRGGETMAPNAKRVFYVKYVSSPLFTQILAQRPDVQLDRLENESPDDVVDAGAQRGACVSDRRLAPGDRAAFPGRRRAAGSACPTWSRCRRTARATTPSMWMPARAQGIAVVNQSGGNKEGVAEHALAMMLTLSKRIIETDRRMRAGPGIPRNQYIGRELLNRTVGVIGIGNVGGRVAELCRGLFNMRVLAYDPYLTAAQIARARGREGGAGRAAADRRISSRCIVR